AVSGDLNEADLLRAEKHANATKDFLFTWTISPFGSSEQVAQPVKLLWEGQDVYFSELSHDILSGSSGYGSFMTSEDDDNGASEREGLRDVPGTVYNSQVGATSATLSVIDDLSSKLGLPNYPQTVDPTKFLQNNDTVPENIDLSQIGLVGAWSNNGVGELNSSRLSLISIQTWLAHSFKSTPLEYGAKGNGWVELDVMMVRLETLYAPGGTFKVRSEDGIRTVGFDAAVCVEAIEPWVVDTYNATTGRVTTLKVVGKGDLSTVHLNYGKQKNRSIKGLSMGVNSTGKLEVFGLAHGNSRNQILKVRAFLWIFDDHVDLWI
ncbi:6406_t:CDS:2, partial [Acaulospora colombiana]